MRLNEGTAQNNQFKTSSTVLAQNCTLDCREEFWANTNQTCEDGNNWRECLVVKIQAGCQVEFTQELNGACNQQQTQTDCSQADNECNKAEEIDAAKDDKNAQCELAKEWRECLHGFMKAGCAEIEIPYKIAYTQASNNCIA
ncbi:hypothetical protein ElyMa_004930300 [Elysia marginata]|uniref:Uncharacterized protein n=1 Tax=Elysia marginata TaxID=1093978 RepID=A0AAV4J1L2_9GAST|nr:hypothetical protein ElyMa_004930300 [Elysia marginata]